MFRRLLFIGYDFGKHMGRKNISAYAASTAFFIFLSLIPALMLLCSLLPYTPITEANLMTVAKDNLAKQQMERKALEKENLEKSSSKKEKVLK